MIFGKCKLHTTRSGVMQILNKFFRNKHCLPSPVHRYENCFCTPMPLWRNRAHSLWHSKAWRTNRQTRKLYYCKHYRAMRRQKFTNRL